MNPRLYCLLCAALLVPNAWAQNQIYRCGTNEYTNNAAQAKQQRCTLVEGGNVTVLQGQRPTPPAPSPSAGASSASAPAAKLNSPEQRARDSDARTILEAELRKAESRLAELTKEYNNGAPERNALDLRNPQRYTERTAELKASLARAESDVAGIRREITRLPKP